MFCSFQDAELTGSEKELAELKETLLQDKDMKMVGEIVNKAGTLDQVQTSRADSDQGR